MAEIPAPLGFAGSSTDEAAIATFIEKQLKIDEAVVDDKVHYVETFLELAKFQYGRKEVIHIEHFMLKRVALIASGAFPCLYQPRVLSIYELAVIVRMQSKFRRKLAAKRKLKQGLEGLDEPHSSPVLTPTGTKLVKQTNNPIWFGKPDDDFALDENAGALGNLAVHPELVQKPDDYESDQQIQEDQAAPSIQDNDFDIALEKHAPR